MSLMIGTSNFVTRAAAVAYYCGTTRQLGRHKVRSGGLGYKASDIDAMIADGSISIGEPADLPPGAVLSVIKDEGRYQYTVKEAKKSILARDSWVKCENYVQRYDSNWNFVWQPEEFKIRRSFYDKLVENALKDYMSGFGIDWNQYFEPEIAFFDEICCCLRWKHKQSDKEIALTAIYYDDKTGDIYQAGHNYGNLEL